jgi:ATP-GRASP peptide maturase of grasp-with-spasm system
MILILSHNYEGSTSNVAEWLLYANAQFHVLTETDGIKDISYTLNNNGQNKIAITTTGGIEINFDDITSVWYRRGKFMNGSEPLIAEQHKDLDYFLEISKKEWESVNDLLLLSLANKTLIGNYFKSNPNKQEVLRIAQGVGLTIPDTIITSQRKDLDPDCRSINKNISNVSHIAIGSKLFYNRTVEIEASRLPEAFPPSLFQKLVVKKYELRIFFLNDAFYASAIFSQMDHKTEIDFRNYNHLKPNRVVPFELPPTIKKKLRRLMHALDLNTGSIDMMVTPDDKYVFLEVNPDGQFGMVSYPCNYFIERDIANRLLKRA